MLTVRGLAGRGSRREFLRIGGLGALSLAGLLRGRASAGPGLRGKAAIHVLLAGGLSHIDSYDPKPLSPSEIRGEFKAIGTRLPGVSFSEHLPMQAARMHRLAVVRSVVARSSVHNEASAEVLSGWLESEQQLSGRPSLGAAVSRLSPGRASAVPANVWLGQSGLSAIGSSPGFLGPAHKPFVVEGGVMEGLTLPPGVDLGRLQGRRALLATFDGLRRDLDVAGPAEGLEAHRRRAFEMVISGDVRDALDLEREPPGVRERYGASSSLLAARRLVEAGAGLVTVNYLPKAIDRGWDTHAFSFRALRRLLPELDRGVSALVDDLHDRGLDRDVVVLVTGEFGRSPQINGEAGREHWPAVFSCVFAGGGLKVGQVVGSSTAHGEGPKGRSYGLPDVLATVYHALGIDPATTLVDSSGRPLSLLGRGEPIAALT